MVNMPRWLRLILSAILLVGFTLPLYWMVLLSLEMGGNVPIDHVFWWGSAPPQWQNYYRLWAFLPFGRYLFNSLLVVGLAVPLTLLTASLAGFALAQLPAQTTTDLAGMECYLVGHSSGGRLAVSFSVVCMG